MDTLTGKTGEARDRPTTLAFRGNQTGTSLLELVVAMAFVLIAMQGLIGILTSSSRASGANFETAKAKEAARAMLETIQSQPFEEVFALYNANGLDDPGGAGTAPGPNFAVEDLNVLDSDADGMAGEIILPRRSVAGVEELREDDDETRLGMPRDLNGDGLVDALDHSGDYWILPVLVRVSWRSQSGQSRVEFKTVLVNFQ